MLDQWLEQCGVSFRKASLIQDKKTREGPDCLPVCSFIKRGLTETSQLGLFFHPTQWRATLFAKVSAPGAGPRSQSLWTKREERKKEGVEKTEREGVRMGGCVVDGRQLEKKKLIPLDVINGWLSTLLCHVDTVMRLSCCHPDKL